MIYNQNGGDHEVCVESYSCLKQIFSEISFSFGKISVSLHSPYLIVGLLLILDIFEIGK